MVLPRQKIGRQLIRIIPGNIPPISDGKKIMPWFIISMMNQGIKIGGG